MVMKDGIALYRDAHHLSVEGAMALKAELSQGLMTAPVKRLDVEQPATAAAH